MKNLSTYILFIIVVSTGIILSQNRYSASLEIISGQYFEERKIEITVLNGNDEFYKLYKTLQPHYSIPQFEIFNNGNLMLIHSLEGVVEIFDTNAELLNKMEYYSLPPYNEQNIFYCKGNNDIAIIISEALRNKVEIINDLGNIEKSIIIDEGSVSGFVFSYDDISFIVSIYEWNKDEIINKSFYLNSETNEKSLLNYRFNSGFFVKGTDNFIGFTNRQVFDYHLKEKRIIWEKEFSDEQILLDLISFDKNVYAAVSLVPTLIDKNWVYQNLEIINIGDDGIVKSTKNLGEVSAKPKFDFYKNKLVLKLSSNYLEVIE